MASNLTTKYYFQLMHTIVDVIRVTKAAQADYFSLTNYPGAIPLNATTFTSVNDTASCVNDTITYGPMKVNGTIAATVTTLVVDSCVGTRLLPYYLMSSTSGEIMYVTADSTPTTTSSSLTIRRGVLGTTAATLTDNDPLYVLNQLVMDSSSVGAEMIMIYPLPSDPGAKMFSAQRES